MFWLLKLNKCWPPGVPGWFFRQEERTVRSHILQHVHFETPGVLLDSLKSKGQVTFTRFFENDLFPDLKAFVFLLIMGGPVRVHDEQKFS